MSAVTVTYQELPPMASWATDGAPHRHHGAGGGENGTSAMLHMADGGRNQYHDNGCSVSGWNSFTLEGLEAKCDSSRAAAMQAGSSVDWMVGGSLLDSSAESHPPPYGVGQYAPLYNGDPGPAPYSYECGPTGAKKRLPQIRPSAGSPAGHGLVGISAANGSSAPATMAAEELCLVCGDKASGYHYNALTCEGCKGFFRRSITRKAMYYCKYGGHCDIDMYMRRKCQACRLRKCLDIGMRPELVIPEEQCRLKRESKNKMRTINGGGNCASSSAPVISTDERKSNSPQQVTSTDSLSPNPPAAGLTPEQRELVHRLVRYQEQYEMPSDEDLAKLSAFRNERQLPQQQQQQQQQHHHGHTHFQHLAELTILNVQLIVEFTKHLPGFLTLNKDDQLTLLKACSTEILMLKTARRYDQKTDTIVLGNRSTSWAYSRDAYKQAGMGSATDAIFEFAKSMAKMRVDAAEFALLTAVSIFSERPGLTEPRKVEDIQEVYTSTLQAYIDAHRPKNRTVFARLLMKLTDLRTLGCEQADVLFSLKTNGGHGCLPALATSDEKDEDQCGRPGSQQQQDPQQQPPADCSFSGPNHRVPNVRIKVEPLTSSATPSGGHSHFQEDVNFECRSNAYLHTQDDANGTHHFHQHQHQGSPDDRDGIRQQGAVSSSTAFPDTASKWNC